MRTQVLDIQDRETPRLKNPAGHLRPHYAETLKRWRARFKEGADRVRAAFDEPFVRAWRLYLAGSQAAFTTGWMQLFQVTFARGQSHDVPWARG